MAKEKKIKPVSKDKKPMRAISEEAITPLGLKHLIGMFVLFALINLCFFPANKMGIEHNIKYPSDINLLTKDQILKYINEQKPRVILLGNSMLGRGIHLNYFNELTKIPAAKIATGGSESAWWYLAFKNAICRSEVKASTVALFFRDNELTDPSFRVSDEYKPSIDLLCDGSEPLLDRFAYYDQESDVEYFISEHWPLYQKRKKIKTNIDVSIKQKVAKSFFNRPVEYADDATQSVFADTNMNKELFTKFQFKADRKSASADFDFKKKVEVSFLPGIISLAKQNNIKLIFVRVKKRRDLVPNSQPPELIAYIQDLSDYLKKENVIFIDYTNDTRIKEANYSDGDHLDNHDAPMTFTELVADTLPQFYAR